MRYVRHPDGRLEPLRRPNIDTGLGLERLVRTIATCTTHTACLASSWCT
ncbi:hypothetical protein ACIP5Y_37175 [Nocardia sp. NPDC088792]